MRLLRGTEITACDGPVSVHMLAYQYNPNDRHTSDLFARTRQARLKRTKAMVARLGEDYPISWQSVLEQVHEGSGPRSDVRTSPMRWSPRACTARGPRRSPTR